MLLSVLELRYGADPRLLMEVRAILLCRTRVHVNEARSHYAYGACALRNYFCSQGRARGVGMQCAR